MDDYIALLKSSPMGNDLYNYLFSKKRLPTISTGYLGEDTNGSYYPDDNSIKLSYGATSPTLVHEVAHAADNAISQQYWNRRTEWSKPVEPTQFTEGYDKLKGQTANTQYRSPRADLASLLNPLWEMRNREYRASPNELLGWAAGHTVQPGNSYKPPNHLNSTLATEFSILMELAKREQNAPKKKTMLQSLFGS